MGKCAASLAQLAVIALIFFVPQVSSEPPDSTAQAKERIEALREKVQKRLDIDGQADERKRANLPIGRSEGSAPMSSSTAKIKIYDGEAGIPLPVEASANKGEEVVGNDQALRASPLIDLGNVKMPPEVKVTERLQFPELSPCRAGERREEKTPSSSSKGAVLSDVLYVAKGRLPEEWKMMIGSGVAALEVGGSETPFASQYALAHGVPCLPYRVRVLGDRIQYLSGVEAVKNYSESGKGKLHEFFKDEG